MNIAERHLVDFTDELGKKHATLVYTLDCGHGVTVPNTAENRERETYWGAECINCAAGQKPSGKRWHEEVAPGDIALRPVPPKAAP